MEEDVVGVKMVEVFAVVVVIVVVLIDAAAVAKRELGREGIDALREIYLTVYLK